jgi:hypothetical protein
MQSENNFYVEQNHRAWREIFYASFLIIAFSALVFSLYGLGLPLERDNSIYLYAAQRLVEGVPPYLSIFDVKTPLTSFVNALLLLPSQIIFDEPLHGVRIGNMVIVTVTSLLTYRLAMKMFSRKGTALFAPLAMLGFQGYTLMAAVGGRPKVLLLLFLLLALNFLWDRRWFAAGLASALCVFTWQPSGIVLIASLVFAANSGERDRLRAPVLMLGGFLLVTALLSAYFVFMGAFQEFLHGSLLAHWFVERTVEQSELREIVHAIQNGFPFSSSLIVLGLLSIVPFLAVEAWVNWNKHRSASPELAYLLMLVMLVTWSMFDFQAYPDFFVLLPFAALGIQWVLQNLASVIGNTFGFEWRHRCVAAQWVLVCFLLTAPLFAFVGSKIAAGPTLDDERARYETIIRTALGEEGVGRKNVLVLEIPEILALLQLDNSTPYIVQMDGIDRYVASRFGGGIEGWFDAMEAAKPDLLIIKTWRLKRYSSENEKAVLRWLRTSFKPGLVDRGISTWLPIS